MIRMFIAVAIAAAAVASLLTPSAHAQYGSCSSGYCPPSYSGHSYGYSSTPRYYNTRSAWVTRPWPTNPKYFYRYQTCYDAYGNWKNHNDGWLYCVDGHGCYYKHSTIADYFATLAPSPYLEEKGRTEIAYDAQQYEAAKVYAVFMQPGILAQKSMPAARSANEILAPFESTAAARIANAHKSDVSAKDFAMAVYKGAQDQEMENTKIRGQIALAREFGQQEERFLAGLSERRAVLMQQVTIDANATSRGGNAVQFDPAIVKSNELATLLNSRCVSCHGASKQAGDFDLRQYASFKLDKWKLMRRKCEDGDMPKDGEPLTDTEQDLLDDQVAHIRAKS